MTEDRNHLIQRLLEIQGGQCFVGEELLDPTVDRLEIDHIIPRAKGGKDDDNNKAVVCEFHNRNKSDSDLRVARCMARYERIKERCSTAGPNRPNLGDFLIEAGGSKHLLSARLDGNTFTYELVEAGIPRHIIPVFHDKLSNLDSVFLELPIEYIFHDERINPRAVSARIRGLIDEFLDGRPQLHIALAWGGTI